MLLRRHPAGLWVLFTTELWERFAFYAMRAILVLYLVSKTSGTNTPGFGWSDENAYILYGWYTGLVYLAPLFGGWIADRFIGQRSCVIIGAITMALGEFCLAATELVRNNNAEVITASTDFAAFFTFFLGLGLMILGNGFFKPCISVMVGQMYPTEDASGRDAAFTIFYMGINIGAFCSPLVAGTIGEKYGFEYGFLVAGIGMLIGLALFLLLGKKYLVGLGEAPKRKTIAEMTQKERDQYDKNLHEQTRPLVRQDYDRIWVILILSLFVIAFWTVFEQAGSSLNIFAKVDTDRSVSAAVEQMSPSWIASGFIKENDTTVFPATWYQSVNALGIVIFAPLFTILWSVLSRWKLEPSTPAKFALGLLLVSASFLVMIPGALDAAEPDGKAAAYWLVICYLLATWGELCLSPVGLSMVTKLAPIRYQSSFMGIWFLASSAAYFLAGYAAAIFGGSNRSSFVFGEKGGLADFFLILAVFPMVFGFIALALVPMLKKMMHGVH